LLKNKIIKIFNKMNYQIHEGHALLDFKRLINGGHAIIGYSPNRFLYVLKSLLSFIKRQPN
jgi:hypothetical protein